MILYFRDSAFLTSSRIVHRSQINISAITEAKGCVYQSTREFQVPTSIYL